MQGASRKVDGGWSLLWALLETFWKLSIYNFLLHALLWLLVRAVRPSTVWMCLRLPLMVFVQTFCSKFCTKVHTDLSSLCKPIQSLFHLLLWPCGNWIWMECEHKINIHTVCDLNWYYWICKSSISTLTLGQGYVCCKSSIQVSVPLETLN